RLHPRIPLSADSRDTRTILCRLTYRDHGHPIRSKRALGPSSSAIHSYDPSAGSPTETLLRLLLPTNKKVQLTIRARHSRANPGLADPVHQICLLVPSVGATGGAYKGHGRNRCKLVTCFY